MSTYLFPDELIRIMLEVKLMYSKLMANDNEVIANGGRDFKMTLTEDTNWPQNE